MKVIKSILWILVIQIFLINFVTAVNFGARYEVMHDEKYGTTTGTQVSQSFNWSFTGTADCLGFKVGNGGAPGTAAGDVRILPCDSSGKASGNTPITGYKETFAAGEFNNGDHVWNYICFTNASRIDLTQYSCYAYAFFLTADSLNLDGVTAGGFPNGTYANSGDGGATWSAAAQDYVFNLTGTPSAPASASLTITTRDDYNLSNIDSTITLSNSSYSNTSNTTNGQITFYVSDGLYNISISAYNYLNLSFTNYNSSNDLTANLTYYKSRFKSNEKFIDILDNSTITDFTIKYYYIGNNSLELEESSTNGNITSLLNWNNFYYAVIDASGYELKNITFNTSLNYEQLTNISFWPQNSIRITVREESTNNLIDDRNISIELSNNATFLNYSTTDGTLLIQNITPATYSIRFEADDYNVRIYGITVSNRSTQELNAYLTESTSTTIFTIKDKSSLDTISDVLFTMYRFINSTWTPIESKYSDITGRVQVTYEADTHYKFYLAKADYEDFIFYLNPVLFDEYTIQMIRLTEINATQDYDHVSIVYSPKYFYEGVNNFTFIIQNPYGELTEYGYTLTYPGGSTSETDTNTLGSQLESNFTIVNPTLLDTVQLDFYYESSVIGYKNFTFYYPIQYEGGNYTMAKANQSPTYGLGLLERTIIVVFIALLIMGIASLFGQIIGGVVITFIVWSYLVYVGFISIWLVITSIVIGILIMSLRGDT